ncbi:hypothetical protein, partial [Streptococcus pneumoniae]|uniref:hypothetical protein n=1 Tax=Streptococcus pneumoniae TaxID=1313 RepID=UPI001E4816A0
GLYSRELFKRLSKNPRFELAELACFSTVNDNKSKYAQEHSWRYYPNAVDHNDPRIQEYNSNPHNVHGSWRFETICLDFKPDIVLDVRDPWN